jgi:steroid 5-alpha reductase family enzyme
MRARAIAWMVFAYAVALVVGLGVGVGLPGDPPFDHPLVIAGAADVAATIAIFGFSVAFSNSSFYDPYWSVVPIAIVAYWLLGAPPDTVGTIRPVLVLGAVAVWGVRLTFNWGRGWQGLEHEDWRYVDKRNEFPRIHWIVSFAGIHMTPTILVFLGLLPCWVALQAPTNAGIGPFDYLAGAILFSAIKLEADADAQLHRFVREGHKDGRTLTTGVWSWSRHPNYLGEILFWWGLYFFGVAAAPSAWWTIIGPLSITILFLTVSLPLMETRASERRSDYEAVRASIPLLLPRWPRRS